MTSSLVGSEMCIRDRDMVEKTQFLKPPTDLPPINMETEVNKERSVTAVSYTHLTLPTICSV
eukprot:9334408-Prorocentrum_lima.AAC.1